MPHAPSTFTLPSAQNSSGTLARHFCTRFLQHFNGVNTPAATRIQSAIIHAAQGSDKSVADVTRILVEQGLSAERAAFPEEFIKTLEASAAAPRFVIGGHSEKERKLYAEWHSQKPANGYKRVSRT